MKYKDIPIEILTKVKERVIGAGNNYDEDLPDFLPGMSYPDEVVGTQYRVIVEGQFKLGEIVTLIQNDNTYCPKFEGTHCTDYEDWSYLRRINRPDPVMQDKIDVSKLKAFPNKARPNEKVGTKYIVVQNDYNIEPGNIVELIKNDGTKCPYFTKEDIRCVIDWCSLAPLPTKKEEINLNINIKDGKSHINNAESYVPRVSAAITTGSAPRGVAVSSTRSKILVGG